MPSEIADARRRRAARRPPDRRGRRRSTRTGTSPRCPTCSSRPPRRTCRASRSPRSSASAPTTRTSSCSTATSSTRATPPTSTWPSRRSRPAAATWSRPAAPRHPTADKVPCLYVPGNHESYGTDNLNAWKAVFGDPYRTFDHKGVRFVLLNSTRGTFRGSDYAQLPMLQEALAPPPPTARSSASSSSPTTRRTTRTRATRRQLGDRKEVQLIEKLLSESAKPAMMVGSHAQIVNVDRVEGVPYMVLPSSGKSPYGTPDRGGFTGWVRYGVTRGHQGRRARVRAERHRHRPRRPRGRLERHARR